jgi:aspartate 1-decarboxylase
MSYGLYLRWDVASCRLAVPPQGTGRAKFYLTKEYAELSAMRWFLRSKIHNATVTDAQVEYIGSITIDAELIEKAGLTPGEKVLVADNTNGERVETYVISAERGSGAVVMNGAAAHRIHKGDEVIIMGFELSDEPVTARKVLVDEKNRFERYL